jgi:hypothetical protein
MKRARGILCHPETYSYPNNSPLTPAQIVRPQMNSPGDTSELSSTSASSASFSLYRASFGHSRLPDMSGSAAVSFMLWSSTSSNSASMISCIVRDTDDGWDEVISRLAQSGSEDVHGIVSDRNANGNLGIRLVTWHVLLVLCSRPVQTTRHETANDLEMTAECVTYQYGCIRVSKVDSLGR